MDPLCKQVAEWYIGLGSDPAWAAYAWGQVKFLAQEHPSVFGDLPKLVRAMQQEKRDAAAE